MKMKTRRIIVYIILLSVFAVIAYNLYFEIFGNENNQDEIVEQEKAVNENIGTEINIGLIKFDTFNPILTKNKDVANFSKLIFDGLFDYDENMKLKKVLVDEYNYNDNVLFIKLKKDILWHDGSSFTSKDVEFTINMINEFGGIYKENISNIETIEIIDIYNFKLVLKDITKLTEYDLIFPIMSYEYYQNENFETSYKNNIPMGTGIFRFSEKLSDTQYLFKYNAFYYGDKAKLTQINVILYNSTGEAFANVKTKKVDIIDTSVNDYETYIGTIEYNVNKYISNDFLCISINKQNTFLSNKNIRNAINLGIDKQTIFDTVYNGDGYVSQSVIYPHSYLYKNINQNFDINKAKQHIVDSGIKDRITLNLLVSNSNEKNIAICELIKQQLEKINIYINIVQVSNSDYLSRLSAKQYDLAFVDFTIDNNIRLNMFGDNSYYGIFNMESDVINGYINTITSQLEETKVKETIYGMQDIIGDEMPYIGIGFKQNTLILNNNLIGLNESRYSNIYTKIRDVYMKK